MSRVLLAGTAVLAILAIGTALALWQPEPDPGRADAENAEQVALGKTIYAKHCANCHGDKLQGQPNWRIRRPDGRLPAPPHDETGHTWHHPDEHLFLMTKHGIKPPLAPPGYESDMPAFDGVLTADEIRAVLAFIKSAWPPRIRERQSRINRAAQQ